MLIIMCIFISIIFIIVIFLIIFNIYIKLINKIKYNILFIL